MKKLEYLICYYFLILASFHFYINPYWNSRNLIFFSVLVYFVHYKNVHKAVLNYFIFFSSFHFIPLLIRVVYGYENLWLGSFSVFIDFFNSFFIAVIISSNFSNVIIQNFVSTFIKIYAFCFLFNFLFNQSLISEITIFESGFIQGDIYFFFIFVFYLGDYVIQRRSLYISYIISIILNSGRSLYTGLMFFLITRMSKWGRFISLLLAAFVLSTFISLFSEYFGEYVMNFNGNDFTHGRINLWWKSISVFQESSILEKLFGMGPGNFPLIINFFDSVPVLNLGSIELDSFYNIEVDSRTHPHNFIFDTLLGYGLIGVCSYIYLIRRIILKADSAQRTILFSSLFISFTSSYMYLSSFAIWLLFFRLNYYETYCSRWK